MNKTLRKVVFALLALGSLLAIGHKYFDELARLRQVSILAVVGILALYLLVRAMNGEIMRVILCRLGHHISRYEAFLIMMVKTYTNLLIPRAGVGIPAVYLKYRHQVSYAEFGSTTLGLTAVQAVCIGVIGPAVQVLLWAAQHEPANFVVMGVFVVSLIAGIGTLALRVWVRTTWQGRLAQFLRRFNDSWGHLARSRESMPYVVLLQVLILLLRAARLQLAFWAVGANVNYLGILVASLLADLTMLVSITPMALGLREGAIAYSAQMIGTTPAIALTAAILDRLVWTIGVVVLSQIGLWQLESRSYRHQATN